MTTGLSSLESRLNCPACNQSNLIYNRRISEFVICSKCNLFHGTDGTFVKKLDRIKQLKRDPAQTISLGDSFFWEGIEYKVRGRGIFREKGAPYDWEEYYLYADNHYRLLTNYENNFNLFRPAPVPKEHIDGGGLMQPDALSFEGKEYDIYNAYWTRVLFLEGEFPENLFIEYRTLEYIHPPCILVASYLKDSPTNEVSFMHGEYMDATDRLNAFRKPMPKPNSTSGTNLFFKHIKESHLWIGYLVFAILIVGMNRWMDAEGPGETQILYEQIAFDPPKRQGLDSLLMAGLPPQDEPNQVGEFSTTHFEVKEGPTSLEFEIFTPNLSNQWMNFDVSLINETTNEVLYFNEYTEAYHGYEGGEHWAESYQIKRGHLNNVSAGRYHLEAEVSGSKGIARIPIEFKVFTGTPPENTWFFLLTTLVVPLVFSGIRYSQNSKRWDNSNFGGA